MCILIPVARSSRILLVSGLLGLLLVLLGCSTAWRLGLVRLWGFLVASWMVMMALALLTVALFVVVTTLCGTLGTWLVAVLGVVGWRGHVLLLGPRVLILNLIAQIVILSVLWTVAALFVSVIILFLALFFAIFLVVLARLRAHLFVIWLGNWLRSLLLLLVSLLLLLRLRVLPLLQIYQVVHRDNRLLAMLVLLLILTFVLLGGHCLNVARSCIHCILRRIPLGSVILVHGSWLLHILHWSWMICIRLSVWTALFSLLTLWLIYILHLVRLAFGVVAMDTLRCFSDLLLGLFRLSYWNKNMRMLSKNVRNDCYW